MTAQRAAVEAAVRSAGGRVIGSRVSMAWGRARPGLLLEPCSLSEARPDSFDLVVWETPAGSACNGLSRALRDGALHWVTEPIRRCLSLQVVLPGLSYVAPHATNGRGDASDARLQSFLQRVRAFVANPVAPVVPGKSPAPGGQGLGA